MAFGFYITTATCQHNRQVGVSIFFFPEMQCFFSIASFGVLQGTRKPLVRFHPLVPKQSVYTGGGQTLCFKGNLRGQGRDIHFQALAKIIHKGLHIHRMWLFDGFCVTSLWNPDRFCSEALTDCLAKQAEIVGDTCSWDQEALQEQLNWIDTHPFLSVFTKFKVRSEDAS